MELAIDAIAATRAAGEASALANSAALTTLESASSRLSLSTLEKEATTSVDAGDGANVEAMSEYASSSFARSFYPKPSSNFFDHTDLVSPMSSMRGEESSGLENGSMFRAFSSRDNVSRVSGSDLYAVTRSGREVPEEELPESGARADVPGELRFTPNMTSDDISKLFLAKWAKVKEESAVPERMIADAEVEAVVPEHTVPEVTAVDRVPESVADDVSDYQSFVDEEAEVVVPERATSNVGDDDPDLEHATSNGGDDDPDLERATSNGGDDDHIPERVTPEAVAEDLHSASTEAEPVKAQQSWLKKYGSHLFNVTLMGGPMIGQEVQSVKQYKDQEEQVRQQMILQQEQAELESLTQGLAEIFPRS